MTSAIDEGPEYGNWVPKRVIYASALVALVLSISTAWFIYLVIPAVLMLLAVAYLTYVRYQFSPSGGDIQNSVRDLVITSLDWDGNGRALDIGCGNGALTIMLAKKYSSARVIGIDLWGKVWEYSREVCESNARIEGVDGQVEFQKGNAVSLPFDEGHFDAVVSNLVFHDAGGSRDKREVIREALRVVRKGGSFSFQDEFLVSNMYGNPDDLVKTIRGWGIEKIELIRTCDMDFIPRSLKMPMFLGTMAIIAGVK